MRKNVNEFRFKKALRFSKWYKTYMGCYRAANLLYAFDVDRMIQVRKPDGAVSWLLPRGEQEVSK
jgi:hypothetical protein